MKKAQVLPQKIDEIIDRDYTRVEKWHDAFEQLQHDNAMIQRLFARCLTERICVQALIDNVPDYLWIKDATGRFLIANNAIAFDSGRRNPDEMIGLTDFELHTPEAAEQFFAEEQDILRTGIPMIDKEECIVASSGAKKWLSSTKVCLRNQENEIDGILGISRDITDRKLAEGLLCWQANILEMIATGAPLEAVLERHMRFIETQLIGICGSITLLDKDGSHTRYGAASDRSEDFGAALDDGRRLAASQRYRSHWPTPIRSHLGVLLGTFVMHSNEIRGPNAAETRIADIATRIAGIAIERKQSDERIRFMTNHDALTGLPNRALLKDRLAQALLYAAQYDRSATVVLIDLDNFKFVNDSLGHNFGDALLKIVADRMVHSVSLTNTVCRLCADEFVVVLLDQPNKADVANLQKLRAAIAEPINLDGHDIRITGSIGIANYPKDGADADTLIGNAKAAMYLAKEIGRDNFQFYTPELTSNAHEKLLLLEELRNAIIRSEFILHYQPQVDLRTGRVFAVEALIRWLHPTRGLIPPFKIIPLAEESGLIVQIGEWVLLEACRQNKAWQDAGMQPMTICVNVSARQFRDKDLVGQIAVSLATSGMDAKYLELELTESLIMQNIGSAVDKMKALQALGVQLSIDDFGTGYSSLAALKTFPVARLKIDKSFIKDLATNEDDQAVTTAVISLGKKLGLRVIAEGVETDSQLAFLRENHCDEMQGYYFSRPIPAAEIEELLKSTAGIKAAVPQAAAGQGCRIL